MRSSRILFCLLSFALAAGAQVSFVRVTPWPRQAKAVVTHTIDDASRFVPATLDAIRGRFGGGALQRASSLAPNRNRDRDPGKSDR